MLTVINPASEKVLVQLPEDDAVSVANKVVQAKAAQPIWAACSYRERAQAIERFSQLLSEQAGDLAATLTAETGKPITQARAEVRTTASRVAFFLEQAERVLAPETVLADAELGLQEQITHEPLGIIANISAWNYPYFVGSNVFIPALLAGNAVLYKPSEYASLTGRSIAALMQAAGVPEGIFQTVLGDGKVGALLLDHPLNGVFFTGSYTTGSKIAVAAAKHLMKVQLELGGKDAAYICDDVSVQTVAGAVADGAFYNTGQSCCALERIYVHEAVYEAFVEAFLTTVQGFQVGDPNHDETYIGPLARSAQLTVLEAQVSDALAQGATLLCGGKRLPRTGFFFAPTVLVAVNHSMSVMRDESFGPVIGIQKVKDDAEAAQLMADTPYGLTASVYTAERTRAERILSQLNTGTAYWNCCDRVSPRLPWSGRGHSGQGLTLSTYGIQTFTQPKAWHFKAWL
ncbi:aldehyde dehydrogenase family protein [Leptolyngbya sp. FACHB-261]|uniref:aldehyde dehydrogenase family protein n=1 Tax=Leptolyngbya sp. FACHB-261 TaxID=2692806 RepID=UPI0016821C56|nr:aldehyde dehydrogenase family protein [Leptolyngbya sp. FACHB-261]MBD2100674.1 aldehyde dehydrogenase family protein [Leptolyngbya sp. FACHB-261]